MLRIDHVMLATNTIQSATQLLRERCGLSCFQGGLHADGTRTWVAPLGPKYIQYLEILAIEDPTLASQDAFGRWLTEKLKGEEVFIFAGWAIQTDEIDRICTRLKLSPITGSVTRPNGSRSSWTEAGFEEASTSGWLPFFIQYDDVDARRERSAADLARVNHAIEPLEIAWLELGGDEKRLRDWLGDVQLPLRIVDSRPGLRSVGITTTQGEVVLS